MNTLWDQAAARASTAVGTPTKPVSSGFVIERTNDESKSGWNNAGLSSSELVTSSYTQNNNTPKQHVPIIHDDENDEKYTQGIHEDSISNTNDEAVQTPVPLSHEELASAEVRALAKKLAPVLVEADAMLARELFHTSDKHNHNKWYDDNDDIDDEMMNLEESEAMLRKEMEAAMDFSFYNQDDDDDSSEDYMMQLFPSRNTTGTGTAATSTMSADYNSVQSNQPVIIEDMDEYASESNNTDGESYWLNREQQILHLHGNQEQTASFHSQIPNTFIDEVRATNPRTGVSSTRKISANNEIKTETAISNTKESTFFLDETKSAALRQPTDDSINEEQETVENLSPSSIHNKPRDIRQSLLEDPKAPTAISGGAALMASSIPSSEDILAHDSSISKPAHQQQEQKQHQIPTQQQQQQKLPQPQHHRWQSAATTTPKPQTNQRRSLSSTVFDFLFSPEISASKAISSLVANDTSNPRSSTSSVATTPPSSNNRPAGPVDTPNRRQGLDTPLLYTAEDIKQTITETESHQQQNINDASVDNNHPSSTRNRPNASKMIYTIRDHVKALHLQNEDECGWYAVDMSKHFVTSSSPRVDDNSDDSSPTIPHIPPVVKEYCVSMPESRLRRMYIGLRDGLGPDIKQRILPTLLEQNAASPKHDDRTYALFPVRTIVFRIRPDVLCGAVMDAVYAALKVNLNAKICKRQGSHCQALLPSIKVDVVDENLNHSFNTDIDEDEVNQADRGIPDVSDLYGLDLGYPYAFEERQQQQQSTERKKPNVAWYYLPFFVDIQLTSYKSELCERSLVIRVFDSDVLVFDENDDQEDSSGADISSSQDIGENDVLLVAGFDRFKSKHLPKDNIIPNDNASLHVRECGSLIQRIESQDEHHHSISKRIRVPQNVGRDKAKSIVSNHLLNNYRAHPSVKYGHVTVPSLNKDDFDIMKSSWRMLLAVWEELDSRDLTYSSLASARFGAFPSLPTLDVQYCSQIRKISRDTMVSQLLKSAGELEDYAREAELACANMISLLRPTFEKYGVRPPLLPKQAKTLSEYPIDYVPPHEACPPWGEKVQTALNRVQEMASTATTPNGLAVSPPLFFGQSSFGLGSIDVRQSFDMANKAVAMVWTAFQTQDDHEQSVRLDRKNMQVMDRLANMQRHEKLSIQVLAVSASQSQKALEASLDFMNNPMRIQEVPLIKWSVNVGGATGICTVSANYILFVTQLIPIIGGYTKTIFHLKDIELKVDEIPPSLFSPSSMNITIIKNDRAVFSFKPLTDGARLKSFLDVVKMATLEDELDLSDYNAEEDIV